MEISRSLTDAERSAVEARVVDLEGRFNDRAPRLLEGLVSALMGSYPSMRTQAGEAAFTTISAYRSALDDLPIWAVAAAIDSWRRSTVVGNYNTKFPPSTAELHEVAAATAYHYRVELMRLKRMLTAVPRGPTLTPISREKKAEIQAVAEKKLAATALEQRAKDLGVSLSDVPDAPPRGPGMGKLDAPI